jgi:phospholipase/carboxylesterase
MMLLHALAHPAVPEAEEGRPLPTLIALHGHGAHAQDLLGLGTMLAHGRLLMICPQAEFAIEPGYPGYTWFRRGADEQRAPGEVERVGALLWRFIDEAIEHYPVDPERVALLGFSQGGSLAFALALAEPTRFAGLAVLSTWLAPDVLAEVTPHSELPRLPVLVQHGSQDELVSIEKARDACETLRGLGVEPEFHEYLMGHQINNESARDLSLWLERVLRLDPVGADAGRG